MPSNIPPITQVVTREEVDLYFKRPENITFLITEKVLMVMGEVDICLIPSTILPITQVGILDFRVALLLLVLFTKVSMVVRDVEVGIRPSTLLIINAVDNIVPTRVPSR